MMKKLVIFDMDGVLIDSERISDGCWVQVFEKYNLEFSEAQRHSLIGVSNDGVKKLFHKVFKKDIFDMLQADWLIRYNDYKEKYGIPLKEGVYDFVMHLKSKGITVAVASSTPSDIAIPILEDQGIYDKMDFHLFGDMVPRRKPDPLIYDMVVDYFNIDKQDVLIFEDSYSGVMAANNAKIDVILVEDLADVKDREDIHYLTSIKSMNECYEKCKTIIFDEMKG